MYKTTELEDGKGSTSLDRKQGAFIKPRGILRQLLHLEVQRTHLEAIKAKPALWFAQAGCWKPLPAAQPIKLVTNTPGDTPHMPPDLAAEWTLPRLVPTITSLYCPAHSAQAGIRALRL